MGKILIALTLALVIELVASLTLTCWPGTGIVCEEKTFLFSLVTAPQNWSFSSLLSYILDNILLLGGTTAIIAGLTFLSKYDFILYAGLGAVFFGFGATLFQLWQQIANIGFFADAGQVVATLFVAPLLIFYLIAVLDFARGVN